MSEDRKRVEKKPITNTSPKTRILEPLEEEKPKSKPSNDKFIRVSITASIDEFKAMSDRIKSGELKWCYFAIDGEKSYHYYLIIK